MVWVYFTESAKYASSAVTRFRRSDFIEEMYAFSFVFANFGIAMAARMPMITTTISSSMSVKPLRFISLSPVVKPVVPNAETPGRRFKQAPCRYQQKRNTLLTHNELQGLRRCRSSLGRSRVLQTVTHQPQGPNQGIGTKTERRGSPRRSPFSTTASAALLANRRAFGTRRGRRSRGRHEADVDGAALRRVDVRDRRRPTGLRAGPRGDRAEIVAGRGAELDVVTSRVRTRNGLGVLHRVGDVRLLLRVCELRDRDGGQNADDHHHDQQLNERETLAVHFSFPCGQAGCSECGDSRKAIQASPMPIPTKAQYSLDSQRIAGVAPVPLIPRAVSRFANSDSPAPGAESGHRHENGAAGKPPPLAFFHYCVGSLTCKPARLRDSPWSPEPRASRGRCRWRSSSPC